MGLYSYVGLGTLMVGFPAVVLYCSLALQIPRYTRLRAAPALIALFAAALFIWNSVVLMHISEWATKSGTNFRDSIVLSALYNSIVLGLFIEFQFAVWRRKREIRHGTGYAAKAADRFIREFAQTS